MNKVLTFVAGVATGATLFILIFLTFSEKKNDDNIKYLKREGKCISQTRFEVIQVLESGHALVVSGSPYDGFIALLIARDGQMFYDNQMLRPPKGYCAKIIGTYRYLSDNGRENTIPVIDMRRK